MSPKRVLAIGLDGVPYGLIEAWAKEGHLPVLASLIEEGAFGPLASTIPPTSGPSWSTFATGMNPGKTGIYDFLYRRPGSYHFPPVNTTHRFGRSLWGILSAEGRKVGVLNMPMSYPVEKVNGFMVSGWMTPYRAKDYTCPPELAQELQEKVGYRIYPTETLAESRKQAFFAASHQLLEMRQRAALYLMQAKPWDFFMAVFFDTDRVLHQAWHYLAPTHPWHRKQSTYNQENQALVRDYFGKVDAAIGRLIEAAGPETTVVILSDHGMGPAHRFVILNNWLLKAGFLRLKSDLWTQAKAALFQAGFTLSNIHRLADALGLAKHAEYQGLYSLDSLLKRVFLSFDDVDWSRSSAYSFGRHLGTIYLNVRGREPQGIIERGRDYEAIREEIISGLVGFSDPETGKPLVGRVARREEIYSGPHLDQAPDLTLWPSLETDIFYGLSDFGSNRLQYSTYRYSGMHRDEGFLVMKGEGVVSGGKLAGAQIQDLAPTILYLMGLARPGEMDGRVLEGAFVPGYLQSHKVATAAGEAEPTDKPPAPTPYDEDEEREVRERLRGLGYLG